jgi:UPF0755 protein
MSFFHRIATLAKEAEKQAIGRLKMLPIRSFLERVFRGRIIFSLIIAGLMIVAAFVFVSPATFPRHSVFIVNEGESVTAVTEALQRHGYINHPFVFKILVSILGGRKGVLAGNYFFRERVGMLEIAWRFTKGQYGLEPIRLTIPEGFTTREIAALLEDNFPKFNKEEFLSIAAGKEGRLFPDTYFFPPDIKAAQVVKALEDNFENRITTIASEIESFGRPLNEVLIMASLLEEEARTAESRRRIAGILWRRLEIGMPLQVDAVFNYIMGKNTYQLTLDDLAIDSPYNTYRYKGLPPGPITNPGLDSIRAAIHPIPSDYLYYLSDREGNMHYAVTHEEHVRNKAKYLIK